MVHGWAATGTAVDPYSARLEEHYAKELAVACIRKRQTFGLGFTL